MRFTTSAVRRALPAVFAALAPSFAAFASAPGLTPKVLQCDGSFIGGSLTSHPNPTVRVEQQTPTGLKIGTKRLSIIPSQTGALWRFDGNYNVTISTCYAGAANGCTAGDSCRTWYYEYYDANGSTTASVGRCTYRDTGGLTCANTMALYGSAINMPIVPLGGAACPGSTTTLAGASGPVAITPLGPLPLPGGGGLASSGFSAQALQLNGSNFASLPDNALWDMTPNYTLSAWINPSAVDGRIISQQSVSGTKYWGMAVGATGRLRHFDSRDTTTPDYTLPAGTVLTGGWHLVHVVRINGSQRRFYVDGRFEGFVTANSTSSFSSHPILNTLEIGRYSGGAGEKFNGSMDDVRIVYSSLSDDDIMLEYNTTIHKYSSNSGVSFSTVAGAYNPVGPPANGTTATIIYEPGEAYTATSRWRFMAQSTSGESSISSNYGPTIDNSPPIPSGLTGTPTSVNDITWNWSMPTRVCLPPGSPSVNYNLVDAVSGALLIPPGPMAHPTFTVGENVPGVPNQLVGRKIRVTDVWGSGLSPSVTVYTLTNPPLAASVGVVSITTGSVMISWNTNGNPAYTRWLVSYAQDAAFTIGLTTPTPLTAGYTGSTQPIGGLLAGTTYHVRVQSFNGRASDAFGGVASVFVSTSFTTLPSAPGLSGAPLSNSSILWSWTSVPGAYYYKLFDVAGSTLYSGGALSFAQGGLSVNTQYLARVEAISSHGPSARTTALAFTLANDPSLPVVVAAYASSATWAWNPNGNPGYTFYEVAVTTDATFSVIVTTLTVNATTATATGLFPGTTYYAQARSINGGQQFGALVPYPSTRTLSDPAVTVNNGPLSAYIAPAGTVGQWQFDEAAGVSAADSSGLSNPATVGCAAFACASTPTWSAGPAGLGSAISFSGLNHGLVRVPDTSTYAYTGSVSVEAWVNPATLAQPNGAGIVVRGSGTVENYALEVFANLWRWTPRAGTSVSSTNTIATNQWTHLIGVYDAALATATLYVNGRPAATALGAPARLAADHDIAIGNRQSGSGSYDRGFLGAIDSVRVLHRALTPAQALAEYESNFISTVTASPPNDAVQIGLAPNAFGAPASIFVTMDPVNHPVSITPAALNAGLSNTPTGHALVPNSLVEIVPIVGGTPFTQNLGSSATVSVPYNDANDDNVIDGSAPPLAASALRMYTLNTAVNRWEQLPTVVDRTARRVTGRTPHFSIFALFAPVTIGAALDQVRVYPVPWTPGSRDRFDGGGITLDRLPQSGSVRVINVAGENVREFAFDGNGAGTAVWDGLNDYGRRVASGVYFLRINSSDGSTSMRKVAIER